MARTATIDLAQNAPIRFAGAGPDRFSSGTTIDDLSFVALNGGGEAIALADAGGTSLSIGGSLGELVHIRRPRRWPLPIDAGGDDDVIDIDSVNAEYNASLAIHGDGGDDTVNLDASVTFAPGRNLVVDLDDADAPGIDAINLGPDACRLLARGEGSATLVTSGPIALAGGSSLVMQDGDLTIEANQQADPTAGDFIGVDVEGALIQSTGTGRVTVLGRGGDDSGGEEFGVRIAGGRGSSPVRYGRIGGPCRGRTGAPPTGPSTSGCTLDPTPALPSPPAGPMCRSIGTPGGGTGDFSTSYGGLHTGGAPKVSAGGGGAVERRRDRGWGVRGEFSATTTGCTWPTRGRASRRTAGDVSGLGDRERRRMVRATSAPNYGVSVLGRRPDRGGRGGGAVSVLGDRREHERHLQPAITGCMRRMTRTPRSLRAAAMCR